MNIFILDIDQKKSVQYHTDKHIVKMPIEATQLLCNAIHQYGITGDCEVYKQSHLKHPCSLWACASLDNWVWLRAFVITLGVEYTYRYGKTHKSVEVARQLIKPNMPYLGLTPFAKCVPDEFRQLDAVTAYREYFKEYKNHIKTYTGREIPYWWI